MIYITPTSSLVAEKSQERAKQFAKKIASTEDRFSTWIDSISEQSESIKNAEDIVRVSCIHRINLKEGKARAWGEAALLHNAFKVKNHSCQFGVEVGIKCPYGVEKLYREQGGDIPSGVRLKKAIEQYNQESNDTFTLNGHCIADMRLRGFMERPVINSSKDAVAMQKQRLLDNFKIHIQSKVEQQVLSLLPEKLHEHKAKKENHKKSEEFSLNM